jgi:hypothetical protein
VVRYLTEFHAEGGSLDAPALQLAEGSFLGNPLSTAIAGPPEGNGTGSRRGGKDDVAGDAASPGFNRNGTVGDQYPWPPSGP